MTGLRAASYALAVGGFAHKRTAGGTIARSARSAHPLVQMRTIGLGVSLLGAGKPATRDTIGLRACLNSGLILL